MCTPKESRSASNPVTSADNTYMNESTDTLVSTPSTIGGDTSIPRNSDWVEFPTDDGTLYLIKAADSGHRPKGMYLGKAIFEGVLKSGSGEHWLLYIILPNGSRGLRLRYAVGGGESPLDDPRMIYRMPDSPLYTFVVVNAKPIGRIEALRDGKAVGNLDMSSVSDALAAMPLHWNQNTGTVSFQGLPASRNGKAPH